MNQPEKRFHFHTGRKLAHLLEYKDEWLEGIPKSSIESFAGTGNPFSLGETKSGHIQLRLERIISYKRNLFLQVASSRFCRNKENDIG